MNDEASLTRDGRLAVMRSHCGMRRMRNANGRAKESARLRNRIKTALFLESILESNAMIYFQGIN